MNRIPIIEEIGVEIENDPQKTWLHNLIFERLSIVEKQQRPIEEKIRSLFFEKVKVVGRTKKYEENKCIPKDEEIMKGLDWTESERSNPALIALIWLCKKKFCDKQNILA